MSFKTLLRDGSSLSGDMIQRIMGVGFVNQTVVGGVGTGYSAGVVGLIAPVITNTPNHFAVTATGTNLVLTINGGWAFVVRDNGSATFDPRTIFVESTTAVSVTLASNSQGSSRTDTICLRVDMTSSPASDGANIARIVIVQGGAANALGNAPADGSLYLPLANVVIANAATSVAQGNVTDLRQGYGANIPRGTLAYNQQTANVAGITTETTSGQTNMPIAPSLTFDGVRRIRITAYCQQIFSTVDTDQFEMRIKEGATRLQGSTVASAGAGIGGSAVAVWIGVPAAGAHVYYVSCLRTSGTGSGTFAASATSPSFIHIDDVGT